MASFFLAALIFWTALSWSRLTIPPLVSSAPRSLLVVAAVGFLVVETASFFVGEVAVFWRGLFPPVASDFPPSTLIRPAERSVPSFSERGVLDHGLSAVLGRGGFGFRSGGSFACNTAFGNAVNELLWGCSLVVPMASALQSILIPRIASSPLYSMSVRRRS